MTPNSLKFNYYTPHEFCMNANIQECILLNKYFSILHCNIRSLAANYDQLITIISELNHQFSIIGLSETKYKLDQANILNTEIPGYTFLSQPSISNAGGVGFFIQNTLNFIKRDEVSTTTDCFEALWIELISKSKKNVLCAVMYRHPHGNISTFMDYLNSSIEKKSDELINTLKTYSFQPYILQATRITDHSETLIDNTFYNSMDHELISGNLICDISDHLPNFMFVYNLPISQCRTDFYTRDYSKLSEIDLCDEIKMLDWREILSHCHNTC